MFFRSFSRFGTSPQVLTNPCCRYRTPDRNSSTAKGDGVPETVGGVQLPPEPSYCCNSGCANCVWIKYAQELARMFDNGDVIAKNKIMEKVHNPELRAFLFTQLGLSEDQK